MAGKFQTLSGFKRYSHCRLIEDNDYTSGEGDDLIGTDGILPCLAITLYDPKTKKGALAHITGLDDALEELMPGRVIDTLLNELGINESEYQRLEASMAGEGICYDETPISDIVRNTIHEHKIQIIGEDLCRGPSRLVFLHCATGNVEVYRICGGFDYINSITTNK